MKRNKQSRRTMRRKLTAVVFALGTSRYAIKVKAGNQMYGNGAKFHGGCCAHGIKSPMDPQRVAA